MGLFDKKFCDICGEKIGLLGNRKLEDGNLCKDCAKKLSPFFDERRHSTVDQIKQQLAYREQNKQVLAGFSSTRCFGEEKKIYLDQRNGTIVVSRLSPGNWSEENPDVIQLSQISSINLDIDEDRDEIYTQGKDGQRVSYTPPRYKYYYNFDLKFIVNHPYFDDFTVRLNDNRIEGMGTMEYNRFQQMAMEVISTLLPGQAMPNMGMPMNNGMNMGMNNGYAPANGMGMGMNNGMPMNNGYAPANGMGMNNGMPMNNGYNQPMNNGYNQPMNNGYGQPMNNGYGQQMNQGYAQPMNNGYNQQMNQGYNQQPQYGQPAQPQAQGQCPFCGAPLTGSAFCTACGAKLTD